MKNPNAERPSPLPSRGSQFENRSTETRTASLAELIDIVMTQLAERIRIRRREAFTKEGV